MFDTNTPPKADCRVLLTYTDSIITGVRVAKDDECLNSVSAFADAMHKRGYRLVSVAEIYHLFSTVEQLCDAGKLSPDDAQQLTQQHIALLTGEEVSHGE